MGERRSIFVNNARNGITGVEIAARIIKECKPYELFLDKTVLSSLSIEEPKVISFAKELNKKGYHIDLANVKDVESLVEEISKGGDKHE